MYALFFVETAKIEKLSFAPLKRIDNHNTMHQNFIEKYRNIKLLSDAKNIMPEKIKEETKFVELLVGVNKQNVESVFRQIDEDNVKKACEIIEFSVEIRPLEVESFLTLVSFITSKFDVESIKYAVRKENKAFTEFKAGDKAILTIKGLGKGEVDIVNHEGDLCIFSESGGYLRMTEYSTRNDLRLDKI